MRQDYYDDWTKHLTPDEELAYREIVEWENAPEKGPGPFQKISLSVLNVMKKLPPEYAAAITDTVRGCLKALQEYAHLTVNEEAISYKISLKCSTICSYDTQRKQIPVRILDEAARECFNFDIAASTISGGLSGAAGFGGFLLDLPLLYGFLFRIIQEIALCYGYRIDTPEEKLYILKILDLGHLPEEISRKSTIAELHTLHTAMRGGVSLNHAESQGLIKGIDALSKRIGFFFSRRTLILGLMIVGGVICAGTNYLLAKQVASAAYHTYRKRFIMDRAMARRMKRL